MTINSSHYSRAVLRISSEEESTDYISEILDTKPTRYLVKGQLLSKRNPKSQKSETYVWLLESGLDENESLELHIKHHLDFLKRKAEVLKELRLKCEIDIVCSFSSDNGQGGFTLDHELLAELTENIIDLVVNLYPPEGQQQK